VKRPRQTSGNPPRTASPGLTPGPDRFGWAACGIFAIALGVRLIHVWQIRKAPFFSVLMGDSRAYDEWAQQIARGDWLGHEVFYQAPLYPYFLGTLYAIAGRDLMMVRICQAIVGSLACVLLGLAGRRFFSWGIGLIAGSLLALYAPAIFFDSLLQKSVLDVFFVCLTLWILSGLTPGPRSALDLVETRTRGRWLWLGLGMGALSLTRENALVLAAVILVWVFVRNGVAGRERVAAAGAFVLGLAMVIAPVALRNHFVGGGFYVTTSQFGPNFYIGNNPQADGTYMPLRFGRGAPEYERQDAIELAERAEGRHLTPAGVSTYWADRALDFIVSQPAAWLRLEGRKVALLWNATEMVDTESQESYAEWSMPVGLLAHVGHFGILVPLAAFGVWATWPQQKRLSIVQAMAIAYAASVVMFYVFARYRFPLVPFLVLFASAGLAALPGFRARGSRAPLVLPTVAAIAIFVNWPILSRDLMEAVTENNLGVALQSEGRLDEATSHYRRAIAFKADYAPAYNNLGTALRAKGDLNQAVVSYERALALQPEFPDAHFNLANVLLDQRKPDAAAGHFQRALPSRRGSVDVHNNLGIALAAEGRPDDAIAEFREAVKLEPDSAQTLRNLGNALASRGSLEEAVAHLRRAVDLDPSDGQARYDLASVLLEARQFAGAVEQFRDALERMPKSVEAHNNLGIALASQGDLESAIDQFQQALRLRPDFEDARRNLTTAIQTRRRR
jgi:Tfp pilus assembly protein PilF/4-amino-4-deoxy-L-arabinose transferase-like glycosyltransferase